MKVWQKKQDGSTKSISRKHVIETTDNGMISLLGGKWTSYRVMGEHTVDRILDLSKFNYTHKNSQTEKIKLVGGYTKLELKDNLVLSPK